MRQIRLFFKDNMANIFFLLILKILTMKTLELENYGVQEMNAEELKITDGGVIGIDDVLIVIGFAIGFLLGWWGVKHAINQ